MAMDKGKGEGQDIVKRERAMSRRKMKDKRG